MIKKLVKLVL